MAGGDQCTAWATITVADYMIKPVSQDRISLSLDRLRRGIAADDHHLNPAVPARFPQRIACLAGRRTCPVDVDAMDHVFAQSNYLEAHAGARCYLLRRSISWMQDQLDPERFVRIHRSHMVRIDAIAQVEALSSGRYRVTLKTGVAIFSVRSYRDRIRAVLHTD
ncbi:MAG: LytTR family transcriptional regulator DNA-binding domain-containing protein [Rhodanobacteraceae bacterium]|nr:LytTR family transcriptional regulator DNA-binding domain-containing protein [Rhodanobacteraceae bacterium]